MVKTYSFYHHTAFSCECSRSTAAVGDYVLVQVTARALKALSQKKVLVESISECRFLDITAPSLSIAISCIRADLFEVQKKVFHNCTVLLHFTVL